MNIEFKENNNMAFMEVEIGECFVYRGKLYLKTKECFGKENAFCLSSNKICVFFGSSFVEPLDSKLILTRKEIEE